MFKKMLRKFVGPWLVDDIIHRLRLLHDPYMLGANRLNLLKHLLDGYTVENNQPSVGYIRWTNLHIVYAGTDYTIQDGNTNKQYVWWDYSVSTTILQTSDTLPDLDEEDIIVFLNKNGTHVTVPITTVLDGSLIVTESVLTDALSANCVTSEKIKAEAVIATKIKAEEVQTIHLIASAVTTPKVANDNITQAAYGFTAGTIDIPYDSWEILQSASLTIYEIDDPLLITFSINLTNTGTATHFVDLRVIDNLDNVIIQTHRARTTAGEETAVSMSGATSREAGSYTFYLEGRAADDTTHSHGKERFLCITELKR